MSDKKKINKIKDIFMCTSLISAHSGCCTLLLFIVLLVFVFFLSCLSFFQKHILLVLLTQSSWQEADEVKQYLRQNERESFIIIWAFKLCHLAGPQFPIENIQRKAELKAVFVVLARVDVTRHAGGPGQDDKHTQRHQVHQTMRGTNSVHIMTHLCWMPQA